MSITATVENDIIKLPPHVHLPDGTKVNIEPRDGPRALAAAANAYNDPKLSDRDPGVRV